MWWLPPPGLENYPNFSFTHQSESVRLDDWHDSSWLVLIETSLRLSAPRGRISTLKPNTVCNSLHSVIEQLYMTGSVWQQPLHIQTYIHTYIRTYVTKLIAAFHELLKLVTCKDGDSEGNGVQERGAVSELETITADGCWSLSRYQWRAVRLGVREQWNMLKEGTEVDGTRCYPHTWRWNNADLHTVQANMGKLNYVS